jgi:AcrR family transcriptional regulator/predicted DNA-binding transcriptional regulator AlpA
VTVSAGQTTALSLSEVVSRTGVPASTIHHYRRAGLIPPPERLAVNRFGYSQEHVEALRLVRLLRERRGLRLDQIAAVVPGLLADPGGGPFAELETSLAELGADTRCRVVEVAIELFSTEGYADVTMSHIASAAGVAKGSVYRHFPSKEALFTAVVEDLVADTALRFATAVRDLGGPEGLAHDPGKAAVVFARLVARAMPILLELGVRAAKGHPGSQVLARTVLRTLADAAGRPLADDPIPAGLVVIRDAFKTVLDWAVEPRWPADAEFGAKQ